MSIMAATSDASGSGPIRDPKVRQVIARLETNRRRPGAHLTLRTLRAWAGSRMTDHSPEAFADVGYSIHPKQGDLIYLLCRAMGARRVVDFATSVGMSALYFATAMRDNGGGKVIGS